LAPISTNPSASLHQRRRLQIKILARGHQVQRCVA
jgi:hypothetical protein